LRSSCAKTLFILKPELRPPDFRATGIYFGRETISIIPASSSSGAGNGAVSAAWHGGDRDSGRFTAWLAEWAGSHA
jgi:hypothetical protein